MMKLAGALGHLKPWQRRALGAGSILFAGIPSILEYNYEFSDSADFVANRYVYTDKSDRQEGSARWESSMM